MKTILVILGVIAVAIALFIASALGLFVLNTNTGTTATTTATSTVITPPATTTPVVATTTGVDNWLWVQATTSAQGIQFSYPNPLSLTYVTAVDWPPVVSLIKGTLACPEAEVDMASHDGKVTHSKRQTINGQVYCVAESGEGAAGSTYTNYQYSTLQGDSVASVYFTLRTPQCLNYDDPKQTACKAEQADFDVAALSVRILKSVKKI